jgi:hypothetical protein
VRGAASPRAARPAMPQRSTAPKTVKAGLTETSAQNRSWGHISNRCCRRGAQQ